tara:strand:+ start:339 stop:806 length:468 start_codon:yes stop_codon:yes gene_type:complete
MAVTFDGINKQIILPSTGSYSVQIDLYGDWKEWIALTDNAKFFPAFDTTGGDDVGSGEEISPYFFLRTDLGWQIKAPEQDGDVIIRGNLFPRVAGQSMFLPSTGGFTVLISQNVSAQSLTRTSENGGGLSIVDVKRAIRQSISPKDKAVIMNKAR